MATNLRDCFDPRHAPRPIQREMLESIEQHWSRNDVLVVDAAVGAGKSAIADAVGRYAGRAAVITPNNLLVEQYTKEYGDALPTLQRRDRYQCVDHNRTCDKSYARAKRYCSDCPYVVARERFYAAPRYVCNYYSYLAHKEWRDVLIVDEAHNLTQMLVGDASIRLWRRTYAYPPDIHTIADVLGWLEDKSYNQKLADTAEYVRRNSERLVVEHTVEPLRGVDEPLLKISPIDARGMPPILWNPYKVKKIILMSATINEHDIYDLGLDNKRICYIHGGSPIPAVSRPIVPISVARMSHAHLEQAIPRLATFIKEVIARHPEKGVVHTTYRVAELLRVYLHEEPRLIWHTRGNKRGQYERFRNAPDGAILVASGMYEGIDLPQDLGRWQVITKLPYPSLADTAIAFKARLRPEWYQWQCIRALVQASGRVARGPDDLGISYIVDSNWDMLYNKHQHLFPQWFREAVV